jgi:hypothetical protein
MLCNLRSVDLYTVGLIVFNFVYQPQKLYSVELCRKIIVSHEQTRIYKIASLTRFKIICRSFAC